MSAEPTTTPFSTRPCSTDHLSTEHCSPEHFSTENCSTKPQANEKQTRLPIGLIEQAAHWHTVMQSGEVSNAEQTAFNTWHAIAEHAQAYKRMALMWQQVDEVELAPARRTLHAVLTDKTSQKQRNKSIQSTFATLSLVVLGVSVGSHYINHDNRLVNYLSPGYLLSDHSTQIGESKVITLSDNTQIHLNTFSAINVEITQDQRIIHLLQGEIKLNVAKHKSKSLIVTTEQGTARALGTQFVVRERGNITDVTVTESRVEVCAVNNPQSTLNIQNTHNTHNTQSTIENSTTENKCQQLTAGQQTHINNNTVLLPKNTRKQFIHDWSQHLLIVENQPVLKVLDELSRYHIGYLSIDRKALANHVVSGVFPLKDLTKSLQVLEGSLSIKIDTYTPLLTVIKAKT